jgi:hypothetical protein
MRRRGGIEGRRGRRRVAAAALLLAASVALAGTCVAQEDPTRRDEFGLKPYDGSDKDLSLPDPVLDRGWPAPQPGDEPPGVAADEDEIDPFKDETAPPRPVDRPPVPSQVEQPKLAPRPLVGPDGKLDFGSPSPEPDAIPGVILEPEIDEPSDVDDEDNAPSPLDRGDAEFHKEANDPGEW